MQYNIRTNKNFTTQYNKLQAEFGTDMARLNGFDDRQLSLTDFVDNFIDEPTVADSSIDGNSNVRRKDIVTLLTEMPKPHRKLLAFNKIYYEYQKAYGFKAANEWLRREWMGQLYMHDADTATFKHYCFAYDLKDLAERGLYFLEDTFNNKPPKHLTTFVDFVKEFINFASNRSSGAVGLPNLIPYMFYFWKKDMENNYLGINKSGYGEFYARQNFQRFIYAVNQPCVRDGQQSAFTNTSVFDRPYFEALFGGSEFPDGTFMIDYEEEIIEFQKLYMEVMAEIRHENMFTFPVSTISLLRKNKKFEDEDFAVWAIRHNMQWADSNLFIDDNVSSLSNCCRLKSDIRDLGYFNSVGGTALKVGSVKVSTINLARIALDTNTEEEYLENEGSTKEDLKDIDEDSINLIKDSIGYYIAYDDLFSTWKELELKLGASEVSEALARFNRNIKDIYKKVFDNIFSTLQGGLSKLGDSSGSRDKAVRDIVELIDDIPTTDNTYDVLGYIYEYLIYKFSTAAKDDGSFYTPHEVSSLISRIVADALQDKDELKVYDPTSITFAN